MTETPASALLGQTLSHYRITGRIGAGGMGEVYRATDTSLGRDVAIKVLPTEVAGDAERLARFRREARLLASLNHPNIAAIYGLEESDGRPFLALELVDGEDLKQRLARGALPVDEALEIALQVAEALEEAHAKGIVHRDLKPANVMRTPSGKVKVLDFGLAKAWAGEPNGEASSSSAELSQSPTLARGGTMAGVVLGTAGYMSPEQARGKAVDKRADVWSFGVLLWEMLTGKALFTGETVTDVIAAVVSREPDLLALPEATPAAVRRLIGRCLRKDPRQRLPGIDGARLDLQDAIGGPANGEGVGRTDEASHEAMRSGTRRRRVAWAVVTVLALAAAAAAPVLRRNTAPPLSPPVHFAIEAPLGWSFRLGGRPVPSPDGRHVVFAAEPAGEKASGAPMLWLRSLRSPAVRPLAGTEGGAEGTPFWSPDGRHVAFFVGGELRRLALADGVAQRICAVPGAGVAAGDWSEAGTILFAAFPGSRIYSVPATGGEAKALTEADLARGERNLMLPQFLPDGRRFLFHVGGVREIAGTYLSSLDAPREKRRIAPLTGGGPRYHAADHVLWFQAGTLYAQRLGARLEPSGEAVAIASVVAGGGFGSGLFKASAATLAFFSGLERPTRLQLAWLGRNGAEVRTVGAPADYGQIALSPDGSTAVVEIWERNQTDLWAVDLARGLPTRIAATPDLELDPVWAPDGREVAYCVMAMDSRERLGVRRRRLGVGEPETVLTVERACPETWAPDGVILGLGEGKTSNNDAWAVRAEGTGPVGPLPSGRVDELQVSPDGRWLAFMSTESGRAEVYIQPFSRNGERVRVSADGGAQPKWRADSGELFFIAPGDRMMAVSVRAGHDRLDVGTPIALFARPGLFPVQVFDDYAPSPDGQRFLVKLPLEEPPKPQLHVVTNWTSLLEEAHR